MMAELDTDGDGSISYQEFLDFAKANSGLMKDSGFVGQSRRCQFTLSDPNSEKWLLFQKILIAQKIDQHLNF
ncbi:hypothetical protein NC653_038799 [Populus alba x Populus x berolinensis]|uniref:EF-hand domain-containing protein n=1 Tax=Populus alba x Populus x berolinensis TaxID=444605 RepID=A0AAD6LHS2_9ROSI|nr:hypothetical protein NC653_038799 [Populus alba x Populus x berolinensis]